MRYAVVAHRYKNTKRGAYTTAQNLHRMFPNYIDHLEEEYVEIVTTERLKNDYDKIIFLTQMPFKYTFPVNITRLINTRHVIFIRSEHNHSIYESCTNGFHYYRNNCDIKYYIPILPKVEEIQHVTPKRPVLGYYARKNLIWDAWWKFCEVVENFGEEVDVYLMGNDAPEVQQYNNVVDYKHTYDNKEFFSNITHYVYPMSNKFVDPFPTSLYEAIQYKKEVIIPKLDRSFKDGIDDIIDCIEDDISLLDWENFRSFYNKIFESGFVYKLDRIWYIGMNDWIKGEVL